MNLKEDPLFIYLYILTFHTYLAGISQQLFSSRRFIYISEGMAMKFNGVSLNDTWSKCIYTRLGNGILGFACFWSGTNHRSQGLSVDIQFVSHVSMKEFLVV